MASVEFKNVTKSFGEFKAVSDVSFDIGDDGWREQVGVPRTPSEQPAACGERVLDSFFNKLCCRRIDHRPHVGFLKRRIAELHRFDCGKQLLGECGRDILMQIKLLDRGATLPGDFKAMTNRRCNSLIKIGVGKHEQWIVTAKLHQATDKPAGVFQRESGRRSPRK